MIEEPQAIKIASRVFVILLYGCALSSCVFSSREPTIEVIEIPVKNSIPEGIAIGQDNQIFLSNIYSRNIIRSSADGSTPEVLQTRYTGTFHGVGITIANGKLYALANVEEDSFRSVLQVIDLQTEKMDSYFELSDTTRSFFNDLAVSSDGVIYITNSDQHTIYRVKDGKLEKFLSSTEIEYPNGIAISPDNDILYIASFTKGIRAYHLYTKEFLNGADVTPLTQGVDGLKWYRNSLIGVKNASPEHKNHEVVRYYLDEKGHYIVDNDTMIINHPDFNVPTTVDIKDGWLYCLANSQLDHLDQEKMELIDEDRLTNTFILKMKL